MNKQQKSEALRKALVAETWYAACEAGHEFWSGADRKTYAAAEKDAKAHDKKIHAGEENAVVLSG